MASILINDLTEEEKQELDIVKATEGYDTWKEMILDLAGVEE